MRVKKLLLATIIIVSSLTSFATDYYIATTVVNVRSGEGREFSISFTLQKGDEVKLLSGNSSWYRVNYLGKIGYASSKYLKYSRTISDPRLDTPKQNVLYLLIAVCVSLALFVLFILVKKIKENQLLKTVTSTNRGVKSERDLVIRLLKYGIPSHTIFHDLYVETHKDNFSQIDLVAVTEVGVIVFEVKDYSGWIFGSANQYHWTQVLAYGQQKYRFYNPIMQNNRHVAELRKKLLQFGNIPFYSIVVFYGNCEFKKVDSVPDGTFLVKSERVLDVVKLISEHNKPVPYVYDVEVFRVLKQAVMNGGIIENQIRHKENIEGMLGKHRIFD